MTCTRCHGLMVNEHLIDMEASDGEMWACTRRCVNCGHRDDAVITQHRRAQTKLRVVPLETMTSPAEMVVAWNPDSVEPLAA